MIRQPQNTRRLFIGFKLPKNDIETSEKVLNELNDLGIKNRTKLENLHFTLCFLGNQTIDRSFDLIKIFENQNFKYDNLILKFNKIEVKYSQKKAMLWANYLANEELKKLFEEVHKLFEIKPTHKFNPHITFCRTRIDQNFINIHNFNHFKFSDFNPNELCLFESKITKKGVQYELLSKQKFKK